MMEKALALSNEYVSHFYFLSQTYAGIYCIIWHIFKKKYITRPEIKKIETRFISIRDGFMTKIKRDQFIFVLLADSHFSLIFIITDSSRANLIAKESTFANFSHFSYIYIHEIYLL